MWTKLLAALLVAGLVPQAAADTFCDATVPCEIGCCGENNICGLGPDYCSPEKCINSCDAKADCNPGDWPSQYFTSDKCPLNVCCSQYGFCGTTDEFCGNKTVTRPSCDVSDQSIKRVIGYYLNAGATRSCGGMVPSGFPQGIYSHIYFAFGTIDPQTFEVLPSSETDKELYLQLAALQTRDLGQELWLSIGGWDFSDSGTPTATTFSDLVNADITYQNGFFYSLIPFMATYGFTGLDIDWEYPAADDRNGRASDFKNFPIFLANLKAALASYNFGLSITLPTSYWYLQHFDLAAIEPSVDWFNFMSYDLHGTWDIGNQWTGAYLGAHTNLTEIETAIDLLWRNNIKPSKVNMGLAFYGRSFTLQSSSCTEPGCPYVSAGDAGPCSAQAGILLSNEISDIISENNLTPTLYKDAGVKTINWNGDQWVSFDDEETFKIKGDFAKSQCLGGVLVWSVDYDDSLHTYSKGLAAGLGNPVNLDSSTGLTSTVAEKSPSGSQNTQDQYCRFFNCGETCPNGFTLVTRDDEKSQIMLDSSQCGSFGNQPLCCPTSTEVPTCRWRGFHNSGSCKGGCNSDEAELGTITAGCRSGYQSACCTVTDSTKPWSKCQWTTGCFGDQTCPSGFSNFLVASRSGWGGRPRCKQGQSYNYCCQDDIPDAFTNCDWHALKSQEQGVQLCDNTCPSGAMHVASEILSAKATRLWGAYPGHVDGCELGYDTFCCAGAPESDLDTRSPPDVYQDQTARDFDRLVQKYLSAPVCPGSYIEHYGPYGSYASRDLLGRATDQSSTLEALVLIFVAWITSERPRQDLSDIWESRLEEYGFGSTGANASLIQFTLYEGDWNGLPTYSPETVIMEMLCDIAESAADMNSVMAATQGLCAYPADISAQDVTKRDVGLDSLISPRRISQFGTGPRSDGQTEPNAYTVLRGIVTGRLSLFYLRWIRGVNNPNGIPREVILELAFWIGPIPGTTPPDQSYYTDYADSNHPNVPGRRDRWIVFHFHIPLDQYTFANRNEHVRLGVAAVSVYHSQGVAEYNSGDPRVEYQYSPTYADNEYNLPPMVDYNDRTLPLSCRDPDPGQRPARWYAGFDYSNNLARLMIPARNRDYAIAFNNFGLWLEQNNVFGVADMAYIWPRLSTVDDISTVRDGRVGFDPQRGAFTTNFLPNGRTPNDPMYAAP